MSEITITYQNWSGSSPVQPEPKTLNLKSNEEKSLEITPNSFSEASGEEVNLKVVPLSENSVTLVYNHLVIKEEGKKGINLTAPSKGESILDKGKSITLATPTMDSGASVLVIFQ